MTAAGGAGDVDRHADGVALRQLGRLEADDDAATAVPSSPAARPASTGSRMRQFAGHSLACTIWRTASVPASHVGNTMPAVARNVGRRWIRIHASVMTPRMPSLPITMRSGLGPAPEPGSRRLSHHPLGVSMRIDSTKSSMWVWLVA